MSKLATVSRRDFLQTTAASVLGVTMMSQTSLAAAKEIIAYRDHHLKDTKAPDSWTALKQIGAKGVEIWVDFDRSLPYLYHPEKTYSIKTKEDVQVLQADLKANGITATAFAMPNQFDARLADELAWVQDTVQAAQMLGTKAIRLDVVPNKIQDRDEFLKFAIDLGKQLDQIASGTGVRFGIENHGGTTNDPAFLDPLFDGVGSDTLGLTLDTANFYWYGHPLESLYGIYERFAGKVVHTHCKSINYPEDRRNVERPRGWEYGKYCMPIHLGDVDFQRVVSILRTANYTGDYCVENESLGRFPEAERGEIMKQEIAYLANLL